MKYAWIKLIISSVTSREMGTKFIRAMNQTPVYSAICNTKD